MSKRGRACVACSKIKIKCELGANTGLQPPCERCLRLNKQCTLSQPKRQKDRVAELEAQVEALTRLLQAQGIQDPTVNSPVASEAPSLTSTVTTTNKKRRRVDDASSSSSPPGSGSSPSGNSSTTRQDQDLSVAALDQFVPFEIQAQLLEHYLDKQFVVFPLVPICGDCSLQSLRADRPVLIYAIIYAAGPGIISIDKQESVAKILLDHLTNIKFSPKLHNLDTLQAILITVLFYRSPRQHVHLSVFGLIEVGLQLVSKLGCEGPLSPPPSKPVSARDTDGDSLDEWRAILVSHLLGTAMSIFMRKKRPLHWTQDHDMCVLQLQYNAISRPTDPWLSQLIRAERVCEQIAETMGFWDPTSCMDLSNPTMRLKTQTCRNLILNFRITIPNHLRTPSISFWEHLATAYLHEPLLHTATNKDSFAAPFVAEHLSVSDFPAPVDVTQDHITALFELTTSVQAMIDIYASHDADTLTAMPGFLHSSRAAYALFILAKIYVATAALGNTLGAVLDPSMTLVGEYANKLIEKGNRVRALDDRCAPARILFAAVGVKNWYLNFTSSISLPSIPLYQQPQGTVMSQIAASNANVASGLDIPLSDTNLGFAATQNGNYDDWENFFYYSSNTADFGLDMLFHEELQPFRERVYDDAPYQTPS